MISIAVLLQAAAEFVSDEKQSVVPLGIARDDHVERMNEHQGLLTSVSACLSEASKVQDPKKRPLIGARGHGASGSFGSEKITRST